LTSLPERVPLTYVGLDYLDRTHALQIGKIVPDGIDFTYQIAPSVDDLFRTMAQDAAYQASEMSTSTFILMASRSDRRLVGLPIFISRSFRHNQVYVNPRSGINQPRDLIGKNVGVPEYQQTAALWIRGFLQHDYGVRPDQIHWWEGGLSTPGFVERLRHKLPANVQVDRIPDDACLEQMLDDGKLDALITAITPETYQRGSPRIRRLFTNSRAVEEEYYKRTALFPIMHVVVLRRDVYEANRWMALSLLNAFEASKRYGMEKMRRLGALAVAHPWIGDEMDRIDEISPDGIFTYGFQKNLHVLEAMTEYSFEQGLSERKVDPRELFAEETHDWVAPEMARLRC
jgi:4,5-dihydroxyphthalate decarboxylase